MTASAADRAAASLTESARFHDYRYASNPLADGTLPAIPAAQWAADLHERGPTQTLPLDTSGHLGCPGPATTPGLCANFIHVCPGDGLITDANATSQLFFVMRGTGATRLEDGTDVSWKAGDLFTRITIVVAAFWIILCMAAVKFSGSAGDVVDEAFGDTDNPQQNLTVEEEADDSSKAPPDESE